MVRFAVNVDRLIFGGSFDPPHRGHLAIIEWVFAQRLAPALDLIPAAVSPFKQDQPPTDGAARRKLLEVACEDLLVDLRERGQSELAERISQNVRLLTLELDRPGPSYSADTCATLRAEFPGETLGLLIGSDSVHELHLWTRIADILAQHPVLIFRRPGDDTARIEQRILDLSAEFTGAQLRLLDNPLVDCSSTDSRRQIAEGARSACLSPGVAALIAERGLYR